tara:strand:+ start:454 stop:759 length:306 start_codon:yes stop_codon:yes gene_type:complete
MKNITFLFAFILLGSVAFASFPVKKSVDQASSELVIQYENSAEDLLPSGVEFSFGGFLAGLLLGLIGVALVHIFSSNSDVKKSSWYGLGTWIILLLILGGI